MNILFLHVREPKNSLFIYIIAVLPGFTQGGNTMAYFRKRGEFWSYTVDVGRDPTTGKRKQKVVSGFKTKREAEKACAELVTEYERGNLVVSASKDTLGAFMADFMQNTVKNDVNANTYDGQLGLMNNHIIPKLGNTKLQKLTPMDIQKFYNQLLSEGLSPGTIHNIGNLLGKTLRVASEWGFAVKNVASLVRKPSYKQTKMNVWTQEEVERFLTDTKSCRFHPFYLIALTTGMRLGEILALDWDHINFKKNLIQVEQTVVYAGNDIYIKPSTKTDSSSRSVTIPDFVVNYLKRLKLEQLPNQLNLVIPGIKSPIVYNSTINKAYKQNLKLSTVTPIRIHDMRHTHATLLLQAGENIKVVSERLGHAKVTTTLNTYAHVLPNMQKSLAENLEKTFRLNL